MRDILSKFNNEIKINDSRNFISPDMTMSFGSKLLSNPIDKEKSSRPRFGLSRLEELG